jgi:hypothetical protein
MEVGCCAAERRQRRGRGKPETCDVLGFTHIWSQMRQGKLTIRHKAIATRRRGLFDMASGAGAVYDATGTFLGPSVMAVSAFLIGVLLAIVCAA